MEVDSKEAADWSDLMRRNSRMENALERIAFCGAGEDYRALREIARKALETNHSK